MIFSDNPEDRYFERIMILIPKYKPKRNGIYLGNKFEYTAKMCDCKWCFHYSKKNGCKIQRCLCIEEIITVEATPAREVMRETMKEIDEPLFKRRLNIFVIERTV